MIKEKLVEIIQSAGYDFWESCEIAEDAINRANKEFQDNPKRKTFRLYVKHTRHSSKESVITFSRK